MKTKTSQFQALKNLEQLTHFLIRIGSISLFVLMSVALNAQSATWTGLFTDDWNFPFNWSPMMVPTATTDVYINSASNNPVIKSGTNAFAKSITVNTGGNLTLATNSTLKVNGSTSSGIFNNGTIENNGDLDIDGCAHDGILNNGGTFTNKHIIKVGSSQKPGFAAIHNKANQTFENQHYIEIVKATLEGVKNEGIIKNTGDFVIGNDNLGDIGDHGLLNWNGGSFTNEQGGQLFLTNLPKAGIINIFSSQFTNKGNLKVGTGAAVGLWGIANDVSSTFDNEANASISVDYTSLTAISNSNSGNFNNKGNINIGYSNKVKKGIDQFSGTFTNEAGGSINIAETDEEGITIDAVFNNHSSIYIGGFKKVGTTGIKNATYGTFNNLSGGDVQIDETGSYGIENLGSFNNKATINLGEQKKVAFAGILNKSAGNFTNDTGGNLEIDETGGYGIENIDQASFINKANLKIGQNKMTWVGIDNTVSASFINEATGDIQIDETSSDGISNDGTITNKGKLTLGANKRIGRLGIYNFGTINNDAGADLKVEETDSDGINNSSGAVFNNSGKLNIGINKSTGFYGFSNSGLLNNNNGGEITIEKVSGQGLDNRGSSATINNNGKLVMGKSNPNGNAFLVNVQSAAFTNGVCGEILLFNSLFNVASATITNNGFIHTNTSKSLSNQSTIINNGIINSVGSFLFVNTNNEIIIGKKTATDCVLNPAFELGNPVDFTINGVFADTNATISAGTYVQATNTFTPSSGFAPNNKFFVKITDTNGGCSKMAVWNVDFSGDTTDPVAKCKANYNVSLVNNNATITGMDIDDGSTDACGIVSYDLDKSTFTCNDLPNSPITVTLTVKDAAGNEDTCTSSVSVTATTPTASTWTGSVSDDWSNPCNWNNGVPGATTDATINSSVPNNPVLKSGKMGLAKSVKIFGGKLTIQSGGDLSISGSTFNGLDNSFGTVENYGTINIDNVGLDGIFSGNGGSTFLNNGNINIGANQNISRIGILMSTGLNNIFTNDVNGVIKIDDTGFSGLYAFTNFINKGKIELGLNKKIKGTGIENLGAFTNENTGDIKIGETDASTFKHGIVNNGSNAFLTNKGNISLGESKKIGNVGIVNIFSANFTNESSGNIVIEEIMFSGVSNSQSAVFTNKGNITVGQTKKPGTHGLNNSATFLNLMNGQINIDETGEEGIANGGGIFTNQATINIGANKPTGKNGISNSGSAFFVNEASGSILVNETSEHGLYNKGIFYNSATIKLGLNKKVAYSGIINTGSGNFTNEFGGTIQIDEVGVMGIENAATFINRATIKMGYNKPISKSGIWNHGSGNFANENGGIYIENTTKTGIELSGGTLTNRDTLSIGATIKSNGSGILLFSNGILSNTGNGEIFIQETVSHGINNQGGNLTNQAKINIGTNKKVGASGIYNVASGSILNEISGQITVDETAFEGIKNSNGTFHNKGIVKVGFSKKTGGVGIQNEVNGSFTNESLIEVNKTTLEGIQNKGNFINKSGLFIGSQNSEINGDGLINSDGANFTNELGATIIIGKVGKNGLVNSIGSSFTNKSTIACGLAFPFAPSGIKLNGVVNSSSSTFINEGGDIHIDGTDLSAISNTSSGVFTNRGNVSLGFTFAVNNGIVNSSTLNNELAGVIKIAKTTQNGIDNSGIFNNSAFIIAGTSQKIGQTAINNNTSGNFNNHAGGDIQIDETGANGIENQGTFTNKAKLNLGKVKNVAFNGIHNKASGIFTNDTGGNLQIDEVGSYGIFNDGQASFINKTVLSMGKNKLVGLNAIRNKSNFTNEASGDIQIDETADNGIVNLGPFTNKGKLTLGVNKKIGNNGIQNFNVFDNESGADLQIEETQNDGFNNGHGATLNNSGKLTIGANKPVGANGLFNFGMVNNNAGGEMSIEQVTTRGIENRNATLNNNGKIEMSKANPNGNASFLNVQSATFTNGFCGDFLLYNGLLNLASATILNNGFFLTNTNESLTNQSTITNNGIINSVGSFLFVNTNNEIIIRKKQAKECIMVPALELGNPVDLTVDGIFTDANATISAGIFVQATNTFTPITPFAASNIFYVKITDTNGGCTRIAKWEVTYMGDVANPVANCKSTHAVQLDANGNASIVATDIDDNSTDGCGIDTYTVNINTFDCSDVINGPVTVTLTVKDEAGNQNTCTTPVTVEDNLPPVVTCKDITVSLNGSGNVTITGIQIYQSGSDNCGIASFSASPNSFNCSNIGTNTVTLTATGYGGDVGTCTSVVTVKDNLAPVAICKNHTVLLDTNGNGSLSPNEIDGGSTDNCAIQNMTINQTNFDCSDIGTHTVTLNLSDTNGNNSSCNTTVAVSDNVVPVAVCKDLTISCGGGQVTIFPSDVDDGSTDNCGTPTLSLDQNVLACTNTPTTVTLTATDAAGNTDNCQATITFQVQQGSISLSINDVEKNEGNFWGITIFTFTVTRSGGTSPVSVNYSTGDGSATTADLDYNFLSGTLNWSNGGSNTKTINVVVRRDNKFEPDENFFVNLNNPTGAVISDGQGEGIILNDDAAPATINPNDGNQSTQPQHFVEADLELNIYPNPVRTVLNIELSAHPTSDSPANSQLKMVDLNGRTIWTHRVQNQENFIQVPTGDWLSGAYILYWINDQNVKTQKVIIE